MAGTRVRAQGPLRSIYDPGLQVTASPPPYGMVGYGLGGGALGQPWVSEAGAGTGRFQLTSLHLLCISFWFPFHFLSSPFHLLSFPFMSFSCPFRFLSFPFRFWGIGAETSTSFQFKLKSFHFVPGHRDHTQGGGVGEGHEPTTSRNKKCGF